MRKSIELHRRTSWIALVGMLLLLLSACASIREEYAATPSQAFDRPEETKLGRAYAEAQSRHPGLSGFRLINNGSSALLTRAALADVAERSIDFQSYIYDDDDIGKFLLERLIAAADRGVRVRMLLDDQELGLNDSLLVLINSHPNIEVRTFNPFPDRTRWSRWFQLLSRLEHLGKRMHNKVFAVDGHAAILGGRNISNRYFEGQSDSNFRDFDLVAFGPIVKQVSAHFDEYWNSSIAVPVAAYPEGVGDRRLADYAKELRESADPEIGPFAEYRSRSAEFEQRVLKGQDDLIWATGTAVAEPPIRQKAGETKSSSEIARTLAIVRQNAKTEMTVETAYFVPTQRGVEVLADLVKRGVRVRILTNSLASTDVVPVHAGYARYREALLDAGVELHEYRTDAPRPTGVRQLLRVGRSESALHAKAIVFDRRMVWIGSANFDPRSRRLNTEDGFLIESEALAKRVLDTMERDLGPENSWRVTLEKDPDSGQKRLYWTGLRNGQMIRLEDEPDVTRGRKASLRVYSLIPEDLL